MRFLTVWGLFPLDGCAGLRSEIEEHAVDACDFSGDALCDVLQQVEGNILDRSGHGVLGVDGAQDDRSALGTLAVLDADALEVGDSGEVLPYLALQTVLSEFFTQDSVALAHSLKPVACDRA